MASKTYVICTLQELMFWWAREELNKWDRTIKHQILETVWEE